MQRAAEPLSRTRSRRLHPTGKNMGQEPQSPDLAVLQAIQQRVLWLTTRMIHEANNIRPSHDKSKVGGHQASSASMVSILTALYFSWLRKGDRVAIKPHASPGAPFHPIFAWHVRPELPHQAPFLRRTASLSKPYQRPRHHRFFNWIGGHGSCGHAIRSAGGPLRGDAFPRLHRTNRAETFRDRAW